MNQNSEVGFLCAGLEKCRLKTKLVHLPSPPEEDISEYERLISGYLPVGMLSNEIVYRTLYKYRDSFGMRYRYFKISEQDLLVVGPYLSDQVTEKELLEICERSGITPKKQRYLRELYDAIKRGE